MDKLIAGLRLVLGEHSARGGEPARLRLASLNSRNVLRGGDEAVNRNA